MSSAYTTRVGDTFASIARKKYGDERYASNISSANPGVSEPLFPGTVVAVPSLPGAPVDRSTNAPSNDDNETAILINGQRFRFWSSVRINRTLDAMDTVEFSAPFDPEAPGFKDTFRPFSYKSLNITVGGDPLFTGTLIGVTPALDNSQKTINVSGYSLPGVLNDCTPPASAYPVEFNDVDLQAIAEALCKPFGLSVQFEGEVGAAFERVAVDPGNTVLSFLSDLARQRSLVVSSTAEGVLLFQQASAPGSPVASLSQGASPVLSVSPSFSPQQYFSHITGLEPVLLGTDGSQYTVKNPHLAGVIRPITFKAGDVQGGDLKTSVEAKLGRMYGNMASYSVSVSTWRDSGGVLWAPNTTVRLIAPNAMVYSSYEFIVRGVRFEREADQESATLDLVLPGSFRGEPPEALPWD